MSDDKATEPTAETVPEAAAEPSPPQQDGVAAADAEKKEEETVAPPPAPEPQADGVSAPSETQPLPAEAPGEAAPAADPAVPEPQPVAPESPETAELKVPEAEQAPAVDSAAPSATEPAEGESVTAPSVDEAPTEPTEATPEPSESAGDVPPSPEPSEPAKSDEPIIAQVQPEGAPLYAGQADPSPRPDLGDQEALPHPALTGHNPGFIPGATESTQAFIPVPGEASAAAVTAQTGEAAEDAKPSDGDKPAESAAGSEDAGLIDQDPAPSATPAVPTAAHVPCAFQDLTGDTLSQLEDHGDEEVKVLQLELQGLANIALAIIKRIDAMSAKKAVPEPIENVQSSAQNVVNQALNIFETEEDDLSNFESASADLILDDIGED